MYIILLVFIIVLGGLCVLTFDPCRPSPQYFKPNPYFTNEVLSKEIIMESAGEANVVGTEIEWKPGKVYIVCRLVHT